MAEVTEVVAPVPRRESWTKAGPVVSHLDETEITALEERTTATSADPSPLGLWALATGTWILGTVFGGAFPSSAFMGTFPVLLIFAGIAQFIAGLFAFRRTNVLWATAFCCLGSLYVTTAVFFLLAAGQAFPNAGDATIMQGFLLESFAFISLALAVAALPTNLAVFSVFACLTVGYALTGIPFLNGNYDVAGWAIIRDIGGWFLVAAGFFAFYTGMAIVVNSIWNRTVVPLGGVVH